MDATKFLPPIPNSTLRATNRVTGFRDFRAEARRLLADAGWPVRDDRELIQAWLAGVTPAQFVRDYLAGAPAREFCGRD